MSMDVHDLTGDKTMNATSCVRLANDDLRPVRLTGRALTLNGDTGASEAAYRRPHAPRSGKPNNAALTGLRFDISSTSKSSGATYGSRISDCSCRFLRLLDRIRAIYGRRIGYSASDQFSQIGRPIWSRGSTAYPSCPLPVSSVDSYSRRQLGTYCRPKSTQLRSKTRADSAQTKLIPSPIPRPVQRVGFTTLRLVLTMTPVPKQLNGSTNDRCAHQITRNKS